jgi:sigma-B regulation protein RsbU (phosphoserine phosphatase)
MTKVSYLLLVDAEQTTATELAEHLTEQGYAVQTATNDQQAIDLLEQQVIDLAILNLNIGADRGYRLLEHIHLSPHLTHVPTLVISSMADDEAILRCFELGAEDYIREPYNLRLLDIRIHNYIEKERLRDAQQDALRKAQKLVHQLETVILPMGIALSTESDFDKLLERILIESKQVCNADAGTLYLRTEENTLRFAIVITDSLGIRLGGTSGKAVTFPPLPLYDEATGEPIHQNVATHCALTGRSINIPDIYQAEGFDFSGAKIFDAQNNYRSVSNLTVPLKDNNGYVIGVMQLLNAQAENGTIIPFDEYNRLVVESLSSQAAIVLNNHLLLEHQKMMSKIENDIQIARRIQLDFLPKSQLAVPGWEIDGRFQPAREVAGDFYDVWMMMNNKRIGFMLGDVCDKGVGAALFMSLTRSLIRAFAMQNYNINWADTLFDSDSGSLGRSMSRQNISASALRTAMTNTNNYITEHHLDLTMFATLFFGMLDPNTGDLFYINGGHPAPMIISPTCEIKARLETTGPAVGMFPESEFVIESAKLEHGDFLFIFSDGATDARNPAGKLFGEKGLQALLLPPAEDVKGLLDRVEDSLNNYISSAVQFDDITLLAIRRL